MEKRLAIFVCDTLFMEARAVLEREAFRAVEIIPIPPKHDTFDSPSSGVCDRMAEQSKAFTHVAVIACPCSMKFEKAVAARIQPLEFYRVDNCFELLLGPEMVQHFLAQGAYLLSPKRAHGFQAYMENMGFSEEMAKDFYGESVHKLLALDTGISETFKTDVLEVARFLKLPFEVLPVGLTHLRLFLLQIIHRFQIDAETAYTNQRLAQITRQTNDYSLVFDQIENLVRLRHEREIIQQVFHLFNLLFAPANIAFFPANRPLQGEPIYMVPDTPFADDAAMRDFGEDSFALDISHRDEPYGRFVIWRISFPRYLKHYKSLSAHLNSVIGLSFANTRLFMKVSENEAILQENAVRLEELNATKDKFFSIIAHDLINPFNALIGFSSILINQFDSMSPDKRMLFLKNINRSASDTLLLLQNLLKWAQSQSGQIRFRPCSYPALEALQEVQQLITAQAASKKIRITLEVAPGLQVFGDRDMIQTVMRNLLTNAIKFSSPGGEVRVGGLLRDGKVFLSVKDAEVGIPAEEVSKLFESYGKHTTLGTQNEKGTGLGLILCKEFIEQQGGTISVRSQPGEGTEFTIGLPLPVPPAQEVFRDAPDAMA